MELRVVFNSYFFTNDKILEMFFLGELSDRTGHSSIVLNKVIISQILKPHYKYVHPRHIQLKETCQ